MHVNQSSPRSKRTFQDICDDPRGWEWLLYFPFVMVFGAVVGTIGVVWGVVCFVGLLVKKIVTVLIRD